MTNGSNCILWIVITREGLHRVLVGQGIIIRALVEHGCGGMS